jgi:uncharacterized membrane protein
VAIHVAAAIVGFGATFTYPVIQLAAERRDHTALPFALGAILAISRFVALPATTLVGVTSVYQLAAGPYGLDDAWASVGLGLYVAVMSVAILYLAPRYRRAQREAARMLADGSLGALPLSPEYRSAVRGPNVVGPLVAVAVVATVVLMEVKPG